MGWRVVTTARAFWVSGKPALEALAAAGCEAEQSPEAGPLPEERLIPILRDADAVVASSEPYNARVFGACPKLKVVSRCGVGIDAIDLNAATEAGVVVVNTPGAMTEAVGDYAFGLMLSLARRIVEGDALMRSGGWGEYPGTLVCGKTLGLVGFGQIGRAVARRAAGFDMKLLACDPPAAEEDRASGTFSNAFPGLEFTDLDDLLARSDFVSVHAPRLPETESMFNADRFARMKPTAFFINTARGALVDDAALIDALEKGTIAGAAIDVYRQEPLPADHPLRRAPRCLLTPHNAFNAVEAASAMSSQAVHNLLAVMRGERPASTCNPAVWDSPALRVAATGDQP